MIDSLSLTQWLLSSTTMLMTTGLLTLVVLKSFKVTSWRFRSCLAVAVLLQGAMLFRSPVHLGVIQNEGRTQQEQALRTIQSDLSWAISQPAQHLATPAATIGTLESISKNPRTPSTATLHWPTVAWQVYVGVMAVLCLVMVLGYLRIIIASRRLIPAPKEWQNEWNLIAGHHRTSMLMSETVGPLMLRRPTGYALIVPREYWMQLSPDQRRGVLLHELAHIQRRDIYRQLASRLVAVVHWFNPLAWWAASQYEQAAELACDEKVTNQGKRVSAGFASALVQLVQWHETLESQPAQYRSVGLQNMAAPPLKSRVNRLLKPESSGDTMLKKLTLFVFAATIICVSFFQFRLSSAEQDAPESNSLNVHSKQTAESIQAIIDSLDLSDETTNQLASVSETPAGKLALQAYMNALKSKSETDAKSDAVGRFMDLHFATTDSGKLSIRTEKSESIDRWKLKSERLAESVKSLRRMFTEMEKRLDAEQEAAGLLKRFVADEQAAFVLLLFEMKGGDDDVVSQYLRKAVEDFLVDRGDGTHQIVPSAREALDEKLTQIEMADRIRERLMDELPAWSKELDTTEANTKAFAEYLQKPATSNVIGATLSEDSPTSNVDDAIDRLFLHLESACSETAKGLRLSDSDAQAKIKEIMTRVDRTEVMLGRVEEFMHELAETLTDDDELTKRLVNQMKRPIISTLIANDLPYANSDPGEFFRSQLSEVLEETDGGKIRVRDGRETELTEKLTGLLGACRQARRHGGRIERMLAKVQDQSLANSLGESGRYLLLSEIKQFAESHQPDPVKLMREELLVQSSNGKLRVSENKREIVRRILERANKVKAEGEKDDF